MELFITSNLAIGALVAMLILGGVEWDIRRRRRAHREWVRDHAQVSGVVERISVSETFETGSAYVPIIGYTVPDGRRYSMNGESSDHPVFVEGAEVLIAYDPAMPSTARMVEPPSWKRGFSLGDVLAFALLTTIATVVTALIRR